MKLDSQTLTTFVFLASSIVLCRAQVAVDNRSLTVPQQCAMYMSEESVMKKLSLNSAQANVYNQALRKYVLMLSSQAKDADMKTNDVKFANACLNALNPSQTHTLLQIGVPRIGSIALIDPSISTQVGLEPGQVKQIEKICRDFAKRDEDVSAMIANAIDEIPEPKPGADRKKYEKKCAEVAAMYEGERQRIAREKAEADKKALALLSPTQKAKWLDLAGPVKTK